ncbi:hypothetical protein L1887_01127 [Cichorium endivia]|nr:hypothetical protein L1887_01127 [Cichorium endivia]
MYFNPSNQNNDGGLFRFAFNRVNEGSIFLHIEDDSRACSLPPNARISRISSLENMFSISSNSLVSMTSQLSEAEERERGFANRERWNHLRSMGDPKNLLQYMFNALSDSRCQSWEKDLEIKEMEEQLKELVGLLREIEFT